MCNFPGDSVSMRCCLDLPFRAIVLRIWTTVLILHWSIPGVKSHLRVLLWKFPSQRHDDNRPMEGQYPWFILGLTDWLITKTPDSSESPGYQTTERGTRNKIHFSDGSMRRTHVSTRTSQFSWRSGLLVLTLHSSYLRTTKSNGRGLGTYSPIKNSPCDFHAHLN